MPKPMKEDKQRRRRGIHYWRRSQFEILKDVAVEASKFPEWSDFAAFCAESERGLRHDALALLERFIVTVERAPFAERRRFVNWLLTISDRRESRLGLIPQPLHLRVIEPTLLEWTLEEPECSSPHRWLGGEDHLRRAVGINPADEIARRKLIVCILSRVGFSTHELPRGYLGTPKEDLASLREAEVLLQGLSNEEDRSQLGVDIMEERALIEEYLRKR